MAIDAVFLSALCSELNTVLSDARIEKITMPERGMVIFLMHTKNGNQKFLVSAEGGSARAHITKQSFENPSQPPMFCMLLRKYLIGARVLSVTQPRMERILRFDLECRNELGIVSGKSLILELMGKCRNLILLDGEGIIVESLQHRSLDTNEKHPVLPGMLYELPEPQPKTDFFQCENSEFESFMANRDKDKPLDKSILDFFSGLSPLTCREIAFSDTPLEAMNSLKKRVADRDFCPVMLLEKEAPKDFTFMPVRQYGDYYSQKKFDSFSELLDTFYTTKDIQNGLRIRAADINKIVKNTLNRMVRKVTNQKVELQNTRNREQLRRNGDLITANIYRMKKGGRALEAEDFYQENCPLVTVPLDPLKTPQQNAAGYYKAYNKAKHADEMLTKLISEGESNISYLESVLDELSRAESDRDISDIRRELTSQGYIKEKKATKNKQPAARKPLHFVSSSGMDIYVGRTNFENDELTFRTARRYDLWFHAQKIHGSHVILSCAERDADEISIRQSAVIASTYSQSGGGKTPVDYTEVSRVKKPAHSNPGAVLYTDYKTIIVEPDKELCAQLKKE